MNTLAYFMLGYAFFLIVLFAYLYRLDKKQQEIKQLLQELKK
ncbi:MAG: hypothetical protein R3A45_05855 [Bdellovibrionota bacterium]